MTSVWEFPRTRLSNSRSVLAYIAPAPVTQGRVALLERGSVTRKLLKAPFENLLFWTTPKQQLPGSPLQPVSLSYRPVLYNLN